MRLGSYTYIHTLHYIMRSTDVQPRLPSKPSPGPVSVTPLPPGPSNPGPPSRSYSYIHIGEPHRSRHRHPRGKSHCPHSNEYNLISSAGAARKDMINDVDPRVSPDEDGDGDGDYRMGRMVNASLSLKGSASWVLCLWLGAWERKMRYIRRRCV